MGLRDDGRNGEDHERHTVDGNPKPTGRRPAQRPPRSGWQGQPLTCRSVIGAAYDVRARNRTPVRSRASHNAQPSGTSNSPERAVEGGSAAARDRSGIPDYAQPGYSSSPGSHMPEPGNRRCGPRPIRNARVTLPLVRTPSHHSDPPWRPRALLDIASFRRELRNVCTGPSSR